MVRDLEVEFEELLLNRTRPTAQVNVGIKCNRVAKDEDMPWHAVGGKPKPVKPYYLPPLESNTPGTTDSYDEASPSLSNEAS